MIVTFTPNPCIDKTARLQTLEVGELNRLAQVRRDLSGKGINVARMAHALGENVLVTALLGKKGGDWAKSVLDEAGIEHRFVMLDGAVRENLKVLDGAGRLTELNEAGLAVTDAQWAEADAVLLAQAAPGRVFVLSGSLPPGASADTYRRQCAALKAKGAAVLVDADGAALQAALEAPPDIMKPNRFELLQMFGAPQDTPPEGLYTLCDKLLRRGVRWVALSMGEEGALFASREGAWRAQGLKVDVKSPVGAGDCMVAALAAGTARGWGFCDTAALAMAAGAAAAATEGTNPPDVALVKRLKQGVVLERLTFAQ